MSDYYFSDYISYFLIYVLIIAPKNLGTKTVHSYEQLPIGVRALWLYRLIQNLFHKEQKIWIVSPLCKVENFVLCMVLKQTSP